MRKPKLHNRIGRSVATLPVCSLLTLGLWWLPQQAYSHDYAVALLLVALTAYIITETNNTYQVIRTRSRMISSVWLLGMACMGFLHPFQSTLFAAFCLAAAYYLLFRTYQQAQPVADTFHAHLMLAVGSLAFPPLWLFAPFFLWYQLVFMRALSFRSLFAALVGLALPFWFWTAWLLWQEDLTPLVSWAEELEALWLRLPGNLTEWVNRLEAVAVRFPFEDGGVGLAFLLLAVLYLWTGIAYLRNNYDDKIRVRMMFYVYLFQSTLILVFLLLYPDSLQSLLPLLLLSVSPLVAHYFTLRTTWTGLIFFWLALLALLGLGVLTLYPDILRLQKLC